MADILIRGMEMPKHCIDCPCMVDKYGGDNCCLQIEEANDKITSWDDMKAGCQLHELPEHGDLVDIRKVLEIAMQYVADDDGSCSKANADLRELLDEIENAPVIVPSNKEDSQ